MRKYYLKALHKVVDESDIVILVLDARDPEGCRSRLVEEEVRRRESEGKKLVFVLNKIGAILSFFLYFEQYIYLCIDLIPRSNAQAWLKYLRHSTPTLPFLSSASSQHQRTNISSSTAPSLLRLLKAYKPKAGSITIGVVGYPNVGKSSLINSLKRSKVCSRPCIMNFFLFADTYRCFRYVRSLLNRVIQKTFNPFNWSAECG